MAPPGLRLAALVLGLLGPPGRTPPPPGEMPTKATVAVDVLEVFAEADAASFATGTLRRGESVVVVDADIASGWLTIEPPPSSFDWVEQSAVRPEGPGLARVSSAETSIRVGILGAKLPGPPGEVLSRGATVRLIDRPPLHTRTGNRLTTWLAVAPPKGDVRYVRCDGVTTRGSSTAIEPGLPPETSAAGGETKVSFVPDPPPAEGIAAEIARVEAEHRAVLGRPVESWQLAPVRARYEALLKSTTDESSIRAIRARLDLVERHAEVARSARTIQTILDRSRRRDRSVAVTRRRLAAADAPRRAPYDAEGLVQPSSRQIEGRRVFALIGPEGVPVAYLDIPPGLDARPNIARRVGVRGTARYDESLSARLIAVRDLEPLD